MSAIEWLSWPVTAALPAAQRAWIEPARRTVFCGAASLAGGLPLLAAAYGATARRRHLVVTVEVPITGLPPSLDGLCIPQLGDLHAGDCMPRTAIRRAVDLANGLRVIIPFGDAFLHRHLVCLSSQIDRHHRIVLHFELGSGGAGPPCRLLETRLTPIGAGEATAAV